MLVKLMKYEFMAMGRRFLPLFAALLIVSVINRILLGLDMSVPSGIGVAVSVILMVGIIVLILILTIQRFWSNFLSSEGYLMMTLPVCTDRLILSKLFVASIWYVVGANVVALSILIMAVVGVSFTDIIEFIRNAWAMIPFSPPQLALLSVELLVVTVLGLFGNILILYACLSLSMFSNKHRWLLAFGAYVGITTAIQIIVSIVISIGVATAMFTWIGDYINGLSLFTQMQFFVVFIFAIELLSCAAFYFITRYMLKNRLNLQ